MKPCLYYERTICPICDHTLLNRTCCNIIVQVRSKTFYVVYQMNKNDVISMFIVNMRQTMYELVGMFCLRFHTNIVEVPFAVPVQPTDEAA